MKTEHLPQSQQARVVLVGITKHGVQQLTAIAPELPDARILVSDKFAAQVQAFSERSIVYSGALRDQMQALFTDFDQIIFFVSLGAVVRLIAPLLRSKDEDPGIIVVDDAGQFVIPVLSGHVGGANAWAEHLAHLMGAQAVLTTASDVGKTIPVDILGRELGWEVIAPKIHITRVSADVVNGELIAVVQDAGSPDWWKRPNPLPENIHRFSDFNTVDLQKYRSVLWITRQDIPAQVWETLRDRLVVYRPPEGQI